MLEDDPQSARADGFRPDDELALAQGEELRAHETGDAHPAGHADHGHDGPDRGLEEGQHGEEKEEPRKHEHEIHQAHDRGIGHAAMIAGGGAEQDTDEGGDADRDEADGQRDA